jgi:hypothetical protein
MAAAGRLPVVSSLRLGGKMAFSRRERGEHGAEPTASAIGPTTTVNRN